MTENSRSTVVLGAGVVGLATALYLQRSGHQVTVLDPLPPAGGASYGNSGLISRDTAVPIALPGMLRKVPRWLSSREGPLSIRPAYFLRLLPWLLRWVSASRMTRVLEISGAMRALHGQTFECWRELLGAEHYSSLIRETGQVRIWEGEGIGASIELDLCKRHGIEARVLNQDDIRDLYPGISPDIRQGLLIPGNGSTVNPQRLVRTLGELFVGAGGELVSERALKIVPRGDGFMIMTNLAHRDARRLVVATGAWSKELLSPLGIRVPLETERGYHAMLPSASIAPRIPLSVKNRGFGLSSMEHGLRASGTVEFAGLYAPPDERRATILVEHAKRIFPGLEFGQPSYWMGHRPSTPDSLPVLGDVSGYPGLFLAFGHGHFGMTGGPPSARLVARLINGEAPGFDPAPYSVRRFR